MAAYKAIFDPNWEDGRHLHDPHKWRRHKKRRPAGDGEYATYGWEWFGQYSEKSMRKWIAIRGHAYDLLLHNGQVVTVRPKHVANGQGSS